MGLADLCLALFILAAWFDIDLYGSSTASDVIFLVVAEAGLLALGGILGVLASSRPGQDAVILIAHLLTWSYVFARWVVITVGWLAVAVVAAHLVWVFVGALRDRGDGGELYRRHYVVPLAVLVFAVAIASFAPLPYLDWSYYDVPLEARIYLDDAPRGIPNWFPAVGVLYFGGLAAIRLLPWRVAGPRVR